MISHVDFFVAGTPRPAGSKKAFPITRKNGSRGVAVTDAGGTHTKNWKQRVSSIAMDAWDEAPMAGPLRAHFYFVMPRPKSHYGTGRNAGFLKDSAPQYPDKDPDIDKLSRAVMDALTGIVWKDDNQVVQKYQQKDYGPHGGVTIRVETLAAASGSELLDTASALPEVCGEVA